MPCFGCLRKPSSFEDLLKHKKVKELKVKTPRSKVNMRSVIKCNSPVVFIIGPPGVGKKRQAQVIAKKFGYVHLDVPDLVKLEATQNTPRGRHVKWILMKSPNFPEFLHLDLLKEAMAQTANRGIKPAAWLVTGFPCLLEEALMFEEEVGRVALLVHLSGEIRLLMKTIKRNYQNRGMKIPARLREHLIMFGEHLLPLLAAFDDRVEHVGLLEDEQLVFQELFGVVMRFDARKPSNNRPTTDTQKVVDRHKLRRSTASVPTTQHTSHELYLYSPYGPRSQAAKRPRTPTADHRSGPDDESVLEEPTLSRLVTMQPASRPSMGSEQLQLSKLKSLSVSGKKDSMKSSLKKANDDDTFVGPSQKDSGQSSKASNTKPMSATSKLKDATEESKRRSKHVNLIP